MKRFVRVIALILTLMLACPAAQAATPTPPPVQMASTQVEPPAEIRNMLDIAYNEFVTLEGKKLPGSNKFTQWFNRYEWEWCAGFVTWCLLEAGIPVMDSNSIKAEAKKADGGLYLVDGLFSVKASTPGKFVVGSLYSQRTSRIPQKGFILIYGCSYNKTVHAGIVYDVEELGEGRFRITTIEGNIQDSVKMFIHDYDMNATVNTNKTKSTNLSEVPEAEREIPASDTVIYEIMSSKPSASAKSKYIYYVNCFLMPWIPGDPALSTPVPAAEPTPAPTLTPAPTATPAPEATEAPVIADVVALTPPPAVTEEPEATFIPEPTEEPEATFIPEPTAAPTAEPTPAPTAEPTAAPTAEPTAEPAQHTWPCQGEEGRCPYITRDADDAFCRKCDRNDNGVEDSKE